jgi:hypothetical protein
MGVALSTCTTVTGRMRDCRGARRIRALSQAATVRISVRIDGNYTAMGCIRHRWRRDLWTTAVGNVVTLRRVDRLTATVCSVPECTCAGCGFMPRRKLLQESSQPHWEFATDRCAVATDRSAATVQNMGMRTRAVGI